MSPTKAPSFTEVYGHRGARSLAPECTIPSYQTGLQLGVDWVDADIGMTADGVIVVYHDLWLNPDISSRQGVFWATSKEAFKEAHAENFEEAVQPYLIRNLTLAELRQFEAGVLNPNSSYGRYFPEQVAVPGTSIPTLQEVIDFVEKKSNRQVNFQIEIKNNPTVPHWTASPQEFAQALYALLKKNQLLERVEVQAFDWTCLFELQKLDQRIKTAYLVASSDLTRMVNPDPAIAGLLSGGKLLKDYNHSLPQMIKALGGTCYEPEDVALTREDLAEAHRLGLKVVVWTWPEHVGTAFDATLIIHLLDLGVDGIITDDPGKLNALLAARGDRIPSRYT